LADGSPVLFLEGQEKWGKASREAVQQHPNYAKLLRTMSAMHKLTQERHAEVTILVLPTKGQVYRWLLDGRDFQPEGEGASGFAQAILDGCNATGLRCIDMKPFLIAEANRLYRTEGKLLWWRDDTHLGKYGHAALASYIATTVLNKPRVAHENG